MRISFSTQRFSSSANLSYGLKRKNENQNDKNNVGGNLGRNSNKNNVLKGLMEQKTNLMDSKNALMERSLKNGEDPKSIKEKTKEIDKQIEQINKQINELQLEDQRKSLGSDDKNKSKKDKTSKDKLNNDSNGIVKKDESMDTILEFSGNLKKAKALSHQRNTMVSSANQLECEIKTDEKRGIDPVRKRKNLAKMEEGIEKLANKLGEQLNEVNSKVSNNIKNSISNNKNEEVKNIKDDENIENGDKSKRNSNIAEHIIKHYTDNMNDKSEYNGEKVDAVS